MQLLLHYVAIKTFNLGVDLTNLKCSGDVSTLCPKTRVNPVVQLVWPHQLFVESLLIKCISRNASWESSLLKWILDLNLSCQSYLIALFTPLNKFIWSKAPGLKIAFMWLLSNGLDYRLLGVTKIKRWHNLKPDVDFHIHCNLSCLDNPSKITVHQMSAEWCLNNISFQFNSLVRTLTILKLSVLLAVMFTPVAGLIFHSIVKWFK